MTPPTYNAARANEKPIPRLNHPDLDENQVNGACDDMHSDDDIDHDIHDETVDQSVGDPSSEDGSCHGDDDVSHDEPSEQSFADQSNEDGSCHADDDLRHGEPFEQSVAGRSHVNCATEHGSTNGITHDIHEVLVEESNGNGLNELDVKEEDPLLEPINDGADLEEVDEIRKLNQYHYEVVDDEMTMFFESEQAFTPKSTTLMFKSNDEFSGSIPYRDYVSNHY